MRWVTFNRLYAALLLVALASALGVPKPFPPQLRAQLQRLFAPVSGAVYALAHSLDQRLRPAPRDPESSPGGPRSYQQVTEENTALRLHIAHLTEQLHQLQQINADRAVLGSLREFSRPMRVVGADPGGRKSISIDGPIEGIRPGMAVLYPGGLAGRIDRVGFSGGLQAQLVTDRTFRIEARFGRIEPETTGFRMLSEVPVLLEGDGRSSLIGRNIPMEDVTEMGLAVGDFALIADLDYPDILQGYRIGRVGEIRPARSALFAEIVVTPHGRILTLSEVMVLVR